MNELPWWPPVIALLFVAIMYATSKYDAIKLDKEYGKDNISED